MCFTTAGLIKVIPLLWLGLPLLMVQLTPSPPRRPIPSAADPADGSYASTAGALVLAVHRHQPDGDRRLVLACPSTGTASGLTFGFWGEDSDRSSISLLAGPQRLDQPAAAGEPGLRHLVGSAVDADRHHEELAQRRRADRHQRSGRDVLLCTIATMSSSTIHEYYQLPLLLFSSPLIGLGWQTWQYKQRRWLIQMLLSITFIVSLTMLSIDYWAVEHRDIAASGCHLAETIRRELPSECPDRERHQHSIQPCSTWPAVRAG